MTSSMWFAINSRCWWRLASHGPGVSILIRSCQDSDHGEEASAAKNNGPPSSQIPSPVSPLTDVDQGPQIWDENGNAEVPIPVRRVPKPHDPAGQQLKDCQLWLACCS